MFSADKGTFVSGHQSGRVESEEGNEFRDSIGLVGASGRNSPQRICHNTGDANASDPVSKGACSFQFMNDGTTGIAVRAGGTLLFVAATEQQMVFF